MPEPKNALSTKKKSSEPISSGLQTRNSQSLKDIALSVLTVQIPFQGFRVTKDTPGMSNSGLRCRPRRGNGKDARNIAEATAEARHVHRIFGFDSSAATGKKLITRLTTLEVSCSVNVIPASFILSDRLPDTCRRFVDKLLPTAKLCLVPRSPKRTSVRRSFYPPFLAPMVRCTSFAARRASDSGPPVRSSPREIEKMTALRTGASQASLIYLAHVSAFRARPSCTTRLFLSLVEHIRKHEAPQPARPLCVTRKPPCQQLLQVQQESKGNLIKQIGMQVQTQQPLQRRRYAH